MHNPESSIENETDKLVWDFEIQMYHLMYHLIIINKEKRTCRTVDFAVPADHKVKLKESEKYLDLRNIKVMVIPNMIGALGTVN